MYEVSLYYPLSETKEIPTKIYSHIITHVGEVCFSENLSGLTRHGIICGVEIKSSNLVDFFEKLPTDTIIESVIYLNNCKSNARVQTDDIEAKNQTPDNIWEMYQINFPEVKEFIDQHDPVSFTESTTQTDPIDDDEYGSESGTCTEQCKYDTEYSLEMRQWYNKETIIYENNFTSCRQTCASDLKKNMSPDELKIIKICKEYEKNISVRS